MQVTSKDPFPPFHGLQTVSEDPFSSFHGLQTVSEAPFSPFHGLQTVSEGSFSSLHGLQALCEDPFPPFHGLQALCEVPFSPFHGLQTVSEAPFSPFHAVQTVSEAPFSPFHAVQTVCEGSFSLFHGLQTLCEGSFPPFHAVQTVSEDPFPPFHAVQSLSRGVRFLLAHLARLLQEVFLPIHQRYLPLETSFFLLFFTPTIAIPHPLSRENHPKIQKKPPFCSSLAILTAKIPPFLQLERKEGWQPRRCPKGKNKKAALKKGESYTSLGGESGFMLVDWKGAPPATIKTTARSPALPLIRRDQRKILFPPSMLHYSSKGHREHEDSLMFPRSY